MVVCTYAARRACGNTIVHEWEAFKQTSTAYRKASVSCMKE
jgi:hypothetical protein